MNTTWMSNIMKGQRVGSTPSPIKKRGCSTAKFKGSTHLTLAVGEVVEK